MNKPHVKENAPAWPHPIEHGYTITYQFTVGETDYYAVTDTFNTSSQRGLSAMQVYDEWQSRMTHDTLRTFIEAMKQELDGIDGTVRLGKIAQLIQFMDERVNWPVPTADLYYKMGSVLVFDTNESPIYWDQKYNEEKKIPHWKRHGLDTFFLSGILKTYLPWPTIPPAVLDQLQKIVEKAAQTQSNYLANPSPTASETTPRASETPA